MFSHKIKGVLESIFQDLHFYSFQNKYVILLVLKKKKKKGQYKQNSDARNMETISLSLVLNTTQQQIIVLQLEMPQ